MKWIAFLVIGLIATPAICHAQYPGVYVLMDPSMNCRGIMLLHRQGDEVAASFDTTCSESKCHYEGQGALVENSADIGTPGCRINAEFAGGLVFITPDPKCQVCPSGGTIAGKYVPKQKSRGKAK